MYSVPVCEEGQTENCPLTTLVITVLDPLSDDNAPVVNSDAAIAVENTPVTISVLSNDRSGNAGTDLDTSTVVVSTAPVKGTVTVNSDGTVTYTPNEGFTGTDVFTYTVCDTADPSHCQTAKVYVTVVGEGADPVTAASDDFGLMRANAEGTASVSGNVLTNDGNTDPDAELTATLVTDPAILPGTLVFNEDGTYTFTPDAGFAGPVEVVYRVCDDQEPASCATATLHLLVEPATQAPLDFNVTDINVPVIGDVSTNDVVPAGTTYGTPQAGEDNPEGALIVMNEDGSYEFEASEPGVYTYLVPVCEPGQSGDNCKLVPLQITVLDPLAIDNAPVVNPDIATAKEGEPVKINVLANDKSGNLGTELDPKTVKVAEQPDNGTVTVNADGTVTYTPNAGFTGQDVFTYTVCDTSNPVICQTAEVYVTVVGDRSAPVTTASDDYGVVRADTDGTASVSGNVLTNDGNTDSDAELRATLVTDPASLPGTLVFNADGSYTFTPEAGFAGPVEVVYTVCDGQEPASCATATLHILVEPAGNTPVDFNVTDMNVSVSGNVGTNDQVPAGTTYGTPQSQEGNPEGATLTMNADGSYEFKAAEPGVYTYLVPVCEPGDSGESCDLVPLKITVLDPLADDNVPVLNPDIATAKEGEPVKIAVLNNDRSGNVGTDLNPESLSIKDAPKNGTVTVNSDGTVTYTPNEGFTGTDVFTYTVCDTSDPAICALTEVFVTVLPDAMPDVTTASDDYGVVRANTEGTASVSGNVLANDGNTDPDAALTATLVTDPASLPGILVFNADGSYTFTPEAGFAGPLEVVYTVCDGQTPASCATATLHILVEPATQAPLDFNVTDINVPVIGDVSTNDVVPAGTTYGTPQAGEDNPEGALIVMNEDGSYEFEASEPGVYTYLVPVCEPGQSGDNCKLVPLQITVLDPLAIDNAPVVNPDIATAKEGEPVKINVLANDKSGNLGTELDPKTVKVAEQPDNGTVTVNADGTVTYTPNAGFTGQDVFTYTVCDTSNPVICQTAEVYVTVVGDRSAPVTTASDDYGVVRADTDGTASVSGNVLTNDGNTDSDAELRATLVTDPASLPGTLVFNADGSYTFTPEAGFAGPVEVVYTVCDGQEPASCATATLHILVEPAGNTPVDFNVTDMNVSVSGNVGTNDQVPAGTTYGTPQSQEGNPEGATLTMNADGSYEFKAAEPGVYTYLVPVCEPGDSGESCDLVPLKITVLDPLADDNVPVLNPDIATAKEGEPVKIAVLNNDRSGNVGTDLNPESLSIKDAPKNGTVTVNSDGTVTYTPNEGFTGTDVFTYTVCDTSDPAICALTEVFVTVLPDAMPDVTTASDDYGVVRANTEGTASVSGNVLANDGNTDPDAALTATLVTDPASLPGILVFNADGSYTFTPEAGFAGPLEVVYTVCDGQTPASCATSTLHILVEPAPLTLPDVNVTFIDIPVTGSVSTNDVVAEGTTYGNAKGDNSNPEGGELTLNADGTYEFIASVPGVYVYEIEVCLPGQSEDCAVEILTITVLDPASESNAPIVKTDAGLTREGDPITLDVLSNDRAGSMGVSLDASSVKISVQPKNGTVTVDPTTGALTYTPNAGFVGEEVFSYTVCDDQDPSQCSTAEVKVTVVSKDAPNTLVGTDDFVMAQSNEVLTGNVLANDRDAEGDELTVTPQEVSLPEGTFTLNADGSYSFIPAPGFVGPLNIVYRVCDNGDPQACSEATLYLLVTPNELEAIDDNFQDTPVNGLLGGSVGNILENDLMNGRPVKPEEVTITVTNDGGISGIVIDSKGNLIVPNGTAAGTYVILYSICDVNDPTNCDEAMVIVEVFEGVELKISKDVDGSEWYEGDQVTFVLKAENTGLTNATEVEIRDLLPQGMRYVSSTIGGIPSNPIQNGNELLWRASSLKIGEQIEIRVTVKLESLAGGLETTLINVAELGSKEKEMSPDDNVASASIRVKPFMIPNTITPNGDRKNDVFVINGLGKFVSNELVIFNRWGDHVYQKKGYLNDWKAEGLVDGTYFYVLTAVDESGKNHEFKGWLQVITK